MPYKIEASSRGINVLYFIDQNTNKRINIHSAYNPEKEAKRLIKNFKPGRASHILVTGLGLGFHITELSKSLSNCKIIVLEPDKDVIDIYKKYAVESNNNFTIFSSIEEVHSYFEKIDITIFKGFKILQLRTSYSINPQFYDDIINNLNSFISTKIADLLTRFEFEELWVRNILKNLPNAMSSHFISEFFNKFKGFPGIIISAGPSLRKNVKHIKTMQNKCVIICVDTALPVLEKMNITPHFIMVLDAQKHTIKHFLGTNSIKTPVISDMVSYPGVGKLNKNNIIYSTTSKYFDGSNGNLERETTPFMDYLEQYIDPIGDIQSGGSVATSAFDLLLNLGCSSIIFAGQDLAYTGREIHSSGTHHNDSWLTLTNRLKNLETINQAIIRKRQIKYVKNFGGSGKVITDFVLDMYKSWFEESAEKVKIPVYNCTEGGAFIAHTKEIKLSELSKKFENKKENPDIIIKSIMSKAVDRDCKKLIDITNENLIHLQKLKNLSEDLDNFDELLSLSENTDIKKLLNPFLKKCNTYINRNPDMNENKFRKMYISDIKRASDILISNFTEILKELK